MPPRKLPAETLDAENQGAVDPAVDDPELAQAEARAEAARARARRLRELAEAAAGDPDGPSGAETAEGGIASVDAEAVPTVRGRRLRRPGRRVVALLTALGCICASLSGSGYLLWHHRGVVHERQRTAEFVTAAREAILTMLSINARTARADVQRFIDDTTGEFKAGMLLSAEDFVKAAEQSNTNTKGSVQAVAVQSMTDESAIVLVAAKSEVTRPDAPQPESKTIRVVVNLLRDGGALKVSRVEFL
jgi:Mce-associated membrane protein